MKTINANTKRGRAFINSYNNSRETCLADCYGRYSSAKARAERYCREMKARENGRNFMILSFNSFGFSCGWLVDTGLRVETPSNSYFIKF